MFLQEHYVMTQSYSLVRHDDAFLQEHCDREDKLSLFQFLTVQFANR